MSTTRPVRDSWRTRTEPPIVEWYPFPEAAQRFVIPPDRASRKRTAWKDPGGAGLAPVAKRKGVFRAPAERHRTLWEYVPRRSDCLGEPSELVRYPPRSAPPSAGRKVAADEIQVEMTPAPAPTWAVGEPRARQRGPGRDEAHRTHEVTASQHR